MEELLKSIDAKMNVLVALLLNQTKINSDDMPEKDKIKLLSDVGLNNKEIAKIFNKTAQQISDQIYKANKKKR